MPGPGDIDTSGIQIKIVVRDNTIRGDLDRPDNNGVTIIETLRINGCPQGGCSNCLGKNTCFSIDYAKAECNPSTNKIERCWADEVGCLVWNDQDVDCNGVGICTVSGDGVIACTCKTGWTGEKCGQCATGYIKYPDCHLPTAGEALQTIINIDDVNISFNMMYVPGGTFPTGMDDSGTATVDGFWMGETEVTYELWKKVYDWATTDNGNGKRIDGGELYHFANLGRQGGDSKTGPVGNNHHPVTTINWRDAMVWCNAASEAAELTAVYYADSGFTSLIRSVDDSDTVTTTPGSEDNPGVKNDADGFRLPLIMEWECAARYRGTDTTNTVQKTINGVDFSSPTDGIYWTKGDSASGATSDFMDKAATNKVAVYRFDMDGSQTGVTSTAEVKSKLDSGMNELGIYDMSGNVWEWCYYYGNSGRITRGGSWYQIAGVLQVGSTGTYYSHIESNDLGFRLVRNK
jgi:sulfatase modifying factor 1